MVETVLQRRLAECLPPECISVDPKVLSINSQDYFWFSNVLEEDLADFTAEMVVWPRDEADLAAVLAVAYDQRVPVTIRGGGTGNYGQCVPLRGGVVVNMTRLGRILAVDQGSARVQAGVRMSELDAAAAATGQEIRIYPSTYLTATAAGFVGGGSGGIGSITHGQLADGNVLAATVYPVNTRPIPEHVSGPDLACYVHAYGTTGVMADVTVPLAPRITWEGLVVSFPDILVCHEFCESLAEHPGIDKRLICTAEPAIVRHFMRSRLPFQPDRTAALLLVGQGQTERATELAAEFGGRLDFTVPPDAKTRLTDFTWNHTTLWAKKSDPDGLTYLQAGFSVRRYAEQVRAIKAEYGDDFAIHGEYFRAAGQIFAGSLPIVRYKGRDHLDRMVEFLESIGVGVANPHRYLLEEGTLVYNLDELLATRRRNDPAGLLNPGKLRATLDDGDAPGRPFKMASMSLTRRRDL